MTIGMSVEDDAFARAAGFWNKTAPIDEPFALIRARQATLSADYLLRLKE